MRERFTEEVRDVRLFGSKARGDSHEARELLAAREFLRTPFRPLFSFKLYIADLLTGVHQLTDRLAKPVIVRKLPVDCGNRILGNE